MLNPDQLSMVFTCVCSEIEAELVLERRGMNLGDNLSKLFTLREALKQEIKDSVPKQ